MKKKFLYDMLIMFIGIAVNIILGHIIIFFKIPFLFMDSAGTMLTAVVIGPIYGAVIGIFTNIILSIIVDYSNLHYTVVNVLIGILAGIIARKYDFASIKVAIISGLIIGLSSSIISIPISIMLTKGITNKPIDSFIQILKGSGKTLIISITISTLLSSILDKVVSSLMVSMAIKKIPILFRTNKTNNNND